MERFCRQSLNLNSSDPMTNQPNTTMAPPPLCSSCGLHPAHTFLTEIINGVMTNSSLCDPCASLRQVWVDETGTSIHDAKCFYCGDKAAGGSLNQPWESSTRKQAVHYACMRCMGLYNAFLGEAIGSLLVESLSPEEQLLHLQKMVEEIDSKVKLMIAE